MVLIGFTLEYRPKSTIRPKNPRSATTAIGNDRRQRRLTTARNMTSASSSSSSTRRLLPASTLAIVVVVVVVVGAFVFPYAEGGFVPPAALARPRTRPPSGLSGGRPARNDRDDGDSFRGSIGTRGGEDEGAGEGENGASVSAYPFAGPPGWPSRRSVLSAGIASPLLLLRPGESTAAFSSSYAIEPPPAAAPSSYASTSSPLPPPYLRCLLDLPPVSPDSVRVYLCRHGQTENNRLGLMQGSRIDPTLNDTGIRMARRIGAALSYLPDGMSPVGNDGDDGGGSILQLDIAEG